MPRTVLIHLNVSVPDADGTPYTTDEVEALVMAAIEVGCDDDDFRAVFGSPHDIVCTLSEEV